MPVLEEIRKAPLSFHFQPIISIKRHCVIGYEALARPSGGMIDTRTLFGRAAEEGGLHELDAHCREAALGAFARLDGRDPEHLLFINLEADQLGGGRFSIAGFQALAREHGLHPSQIVLEFSAQAASRAPELRPLAAALQNFGFTVALCDVGLGEGESGLLPALRPDIVKFRQDLMGRMESDPVRQELLRCLCALVHRQGGLACLLGVENEEQAMSGLELGADLLQGHHYGRPAALPAQALARTQASVNHSAARFKAGMLQRAQTRRRELGRQTELMDRVVKALEGLPTAGFGPVLAGFINGVASLECLYALDAQGRQTTDTVVWSHQRPDERNSLFAPAKEGADHGLKDYFLGLQTSDGDLFVSEPYVSLATGNLCRTLARRFQAAGGEAIICMDIRSL